VLPRPTLPHTLRPHAVNPARIRDWLRAFARIGYSPDGGMRRLAYTRADLRARQLLLHTFERLGLHTQVDGIGNCFGYLACGREADAPPVLVGSHLDTVPGGGRFDGAIGVVAALELAATIREHNIVTRRPVAFVSFAAEESSRFGRGTIGSGVLAGTWDPEEVLTLRDAHGQQLGNVLARLGTPPAAVAASRREPGAFAAYLELHIEQGRVLEDAGRTIGVVEAIAAPCRLRLRLTGRADHSGATPMGLRRDALAGAAEVILAIERLAAASNGVVGTVGTLRVEPGAMNVVPGQVELSIDIRAMTRVARDPVVAAIRAAIDAIAAARSLTPTIETLSDEDPVTLDPNIAATLERCAQARDLTPLRMPSGMLFIPSRDGISHNRLEWSDLDHIITGTQVLCDAALELAKGEE
jgi:N-carbamoyl-L-amino-acid hydrolase